MTVAEASMALRGISRRTLDRIADGLLPAPRRLGRFRAAYFDHAEFSKGMAGALQCCNGVKRSCRVPNTCWIVRRRSVIAAAPYRACAARPRAQIHAPSVRYAGMEFACTGP